MWGSIKYINICHWFQFDFPLSLKYINCSAFWRIAKPIAQNHPAKKKNNNTYWTGVLSLTLGESGRYLVSFSILISGIPFVIFILLNEPFDETLLKWILLLSARHNCNRFVLFVDELLLLLWLLLWFNWFDPGAWCNETLLFWLYGTAFCTCIGVMHNVPSLFVWICCMLATIDW